MVEPQDIPDELIDALLTKYQKPDDLLGKSGILEQLTKQVVERALQAEITHHLGYEKHGKVVNAEGNTRNGTSKKTLKGKNGSLPIAIPRDRDGSFEPQLVEKNQTHWQGFDDLIISLYARGMSVRTIQGHLKELYHTEVSPAMINAVTDEVSDEVRQWQGRPLDAVYPILYLDCIHVKVRDSGTVGAKAVYLALGVTITVELAESTLEDMERKWNSSYPLIAKSWRANWQRVIPFFAYPPEIRKMIYTTNAIESLNMSLRKVTKAKGGFPRDEAVFKIFWLALRSISKKWTMPVKDWKAALNRFAILFEDRFPT
ncbi:MAG: transposase [Desulfovibrio sp.]|jgi:transposase-like protein|nr:transposase [Desulfovibrio sp.]